MSLTAALNTSLSGLRLNERNLAITAQNIANANTPGYTRKIVDQSAVYLDGVGAGVRIDGISRRVDQYLQETIIEQQAEVGRISVLDNYAERIQVLFGNPGQGNTLDAYTEEFFNQIQSLSESPELTSLQSASVESGIILAQEVSNIAYELEELRFQADQDIDALIDEANEILRQLDVTNLAINRAVALQTSPAGLYDERDTLLDELSSMMDVEYYYEDTGEVKIYMRGGVELLDEDLFQLQYEPANTLEEMINNDPPLAAISVVRMRQDGTLDTDYPKTVVTGGTGAEVTTEIRSGKLKGLLELRDQEIPAVLDQLDEFASTLRDVFNAIHNDGSGYPGALELNGSRLVQADEPTRWVGAFTIAVTDADGRAPASPYADETWTGIRPLSLDLANLDGLEGDGAGYPSTQAIIDEINNALGPRPAKLTLNNMNNIQLASLQGQIPAAGNRFEFNFDLENISSDRADFYVLDTRVFDDGNVDITGANIDTTPQVALDPAATFTTFPPGPNNTEVRVQTVGAHNYQVGDVVYIPPTGTPAVLDGIPQANYTGFVTITAVTGSTFTYDTGVNAGAGAVAGVAGLSSRSSYAEVQSGQQERSTNGSIAADLNGNTNSQFYDIEVDVAVRNYDPNDPTVFTVETTTVRYRVENDTQHLENDRFNAQNVVAGTGTIVAANNSQPYARAVLVDEDGNELPHTDGDYGNQEGYLKIIGNEANGYYVHISDSTSNERGDDTVSPTVPGSNWGFSHYYGLNNFFESNDPIPSGDTLKNSAINLAVEERFYTDPSLISTGDLQRATQPSDPNVPPVYSMERNVGDNSVANRLFQLAVDRHTFEAAGGLSETGTTLGGYTGEILAFSATKAAGYSQNSEDQEALLEGFTSRAQALSGVNLDEELANTILFQNAYTANARVLTVTDELFETLLNSI